MPNTYFMSNLTCIRGFDICHFFKFGGINKKVMIVEGVKMYF
jgi:hypothetical protein